MIYIELPPRVRKLPACWQIHGSPLVQAEILHHVHTLCPLQSTRDSSGSLGQIAAYEHMSALDLSASHARDDAGIAHDNFAEEVSHGRFF